MSRFVGVGLVILLVFCVWPFGSRGETPKTVERPTYEVLRTKTPVKVDGRVDEPVWAQAVPVGPFRNNADGSDSELKTEARALYDSEYLYLAFRFWDENLWSTFRKRDEHLWTEEVAEVFIQADAGNSDYIELEVNPLGTMLDIYLVDIRKPIPYESWNSKNLKWAVHLNGTVDGEPGDSDWSCEIALPHEDVVTAPNRPPLPGDRWRVNLYRVESRPSTAGLAWAPTLKPDFHVPSMFGEFVFSGRTIP